MLEKIKNSSLMTKLLYIFAFILFVVWIIPIMNTYYSNVNTYKENIQELETISSKYGIANKAQKFSENSFQQSAASLFSKVKIENLGKDLYKIDILMRKEDLKSFHTFIETISLRYYIELKNDLEFKTENEEVNVKMTLKAF